MSGRLTEIRQALARTLQQVDAPNVAFGVVTARAEFGEQGLNEQRFVVHADLGDRTDDKEELLEELLDSEGARSLKRALESDRSIGGMAVDTAVIHTTGVRSYLKEDAIQLAAEWTVQVTLEGRA